MFEKLKQLFTKWFAKLCRFLHIYTEKEHNSICEFIKKTYEIQINALKSVASDKDTTIMTMHNENVMMYNLLETTTRKNKDLKEELKVLESAQSEIARLRNVPDDNAKVVKDLQKDLSKALHETEAFGFPGSIPIPGSTCVRTNYSSNTVDEKYGPGEKYTIVRSRRIMLDDETANLNNIPDMYSKILYILRLMEQYDILDKIAYEIMVNAGAKFILAYNPDCTNYELYCEVKAVQPNVFIETREKPE